MTTGLAEKLHQLLRRRGAITFAEFMDLALYDPEGGYYRASNPVGPQGDFFTSPTAHPVFGAVVALQLRQMWEILDRPARFDVVEAGAGSGLLCLDILGFCKLVLPELYEAARYFAVERRAGDLKSLVEEESLQGKVVVKDRDGVLGGVFTGCVLSNELLDSFPVHRVVMQGGQLKEVYVALRQNMLTEVVDEPSTPALAERLAKEGARLGEGWQAEGCLELRPWLSDVARTLRRGFVLTIDYGDVAQGLYSERRRRGTALCHYKHTTNERFYQRIGQQDITAHVDFTAVMMEGSKVGLEPLGMVRQGSFLRNLGLDLFVARLGRMGLPQGTLLANQMAMRELAKPSGLGDFLVLAQGKGAGVPSLHGFAQESGTRRWLESQGAGLHVPLLGPRHMPLLQGKYPHQAGGWYDTYA